MTTRNRQGLLTAICLMGAQVVAVVGMLAVSAVLVEDELPIDTLAEATTVEEPAEPAATSTNDPFRLILF